MENDHMTSIIGTGIANPSVKLPQKVSHSLIRTHYQDELTPRALDVLDKVFSHPSIENRYFSVKNKPELLTLKNENPDKRIDRFTFWAIKLAREASLMALKNAEISLDDIDAIIVNTCTGYICPGISTYLIEDLRLSPTVSAYDLVGSGCGGAIPNLQLAHQILQDPNKKNVLCISVEICSATFQMGNDISLILSNAIFGDGAAAVILSSERNKGLIYKDGTALFLPQYRDDVRYRYKNGELHNHLSPKLPNIIGEYVSEFIQSFLKKHHISIDQIDQWLIHPGGAKMMEMIQEKVSLTDNDLQRARKIYRNYGNMSSPTVLFELHDYITNTKPEKNEDVYMIAYGAGLSIHGCLFENTGFA